MDLLVIFAGVLFLAGFMAGLRFAQWRVHEERRRQEEFWAGKRLRVLRRI